ncbi:MAG TPA: FtsX-like permease family protein [Anaerolineae bacterium]|nr:FtsX-like permease family protein [Anaerolineae bacterium]
MKIQLTLAWRYLTGRKLRAALTILSITLGIMLIFGLSAIVPAFADLINNDIEASKVEFDIIITRDGQALFPATLETDIANIDGTMFVIGAIEKDLNLPSASQITMPDGRQLGSLEIKAANPLDGETPYAQMVVTLGDDLVAGRGIEATDIGQPVVIISQDLANALRLTVGDNLNLPSAQGNMPLEIVGLTSGGRSLDSEIVYTTLAVGQAIFNAPDQINTIIGLIDPNYDLITVQNEVKALLPPTHNFGSFSGGGSAWDSALQMSDAIFGFFGFMTLSMAGLIMFNTFRTVVLERRRDIGMLRAIGATRRTIMSIILIEALIQATIGTTLGLLTGLLATQALIPLLNNFLNNFFAGGTLGQPSYSPSMFFLSLLLGFGIPLASTLWPARAASQLTPMEALRPSSPEETLTHSRRTIIIGLLFLAGALLGLLSGNLTASTLGMALFFISILILSPLLIRPITTIFGRILILAFAREGHLAHKNLGRQPSRAAITASTIAIGIAIIIALSGMISSAINGIASYVDITLDADFMLMPESLFLGSNSLGAGPELAADIAAIDGIDTITTLRQGTIDIDGLTANIIGIDPQTYPQVSGLYFIEGTTADFNQLNAGRTIIINTFLAAQLNLQTGDTLDLTTLNGRQTYQVIAQAADYLNVKTPAIYTSQANMAADFNLHNDTVIMADISPSASAATIQNELIAITQRYPQFSLYSNEKMKTTQIETLESASSIYSVLMAILALPSLLALANTLTINVLERTREIGVLRAIGSLRKQVQRMIVAESLLLAMIGLLIGIIIGLWMSWIFVNALSLIGMPVPYYLPYTGLLVATIVGLTFGILAALAPARQAANLQIVTALAYE